MNRSSASRDPELRAVSQMSFLLLNRLRGCVCVEVSTQASVHDRINAVVVSKVGLSKKLENCCQNDRKMKYVRVTHQFLVIQQIW